MLILGLGSYAEGSGLAAARYFAKQGAEVRVTDLKTRKELAHQIRKLAKYRNISYRLGGHREEDVEWADLVFQNPSVPDTSPYLALARKKNIPIVNDWTLFFQAFPENTVIGVTGTRGKSTTAALLYELVKSAHPDTLLCGNIGASPIVYFSKIKPSTVIVAELSSWLLRGFAPIKRSPHIAVLTNLLRDHLDKYPSLRAYWSDKKYIFKFQKPEDVLITSRRARKSLGSVPSRVLFFDDAKIPPTKLLGAHNVENVRAAVAAARVYGVPERNIARVVKRFSGLPNRLELVKEKDGVRYYNDTTATSPAAVIAALRSLSEAGKKNIILIAGGSDKKLDYGALKKEIAKYVKALILLRGAASAKIGRGIVVGSMKEAIRHTLSATRSGDIVLLSPGAASFGMFKNEFDRGEQFVKEVRKL